MKNRNNIHTKKISFILLSLIASFFILVSVSCHEPIFNMIMQEVKLEENGLNGSIVSFTRGGNYLWLTNGKLYAKDKTPSLESQKYNQQWKEISRPSMTSTTEGTSSVTKYVATDTSNIYILSFSFGESSNGANTVNKKYLHTASLSGGEILSWSEIDISSLTGDNSLNIKVIFDNQAEDDLNRKAYITVSDKVYELKGTSLPEQVTGNGIGTDAGEIINAIYFPKDGNTYLSKYYAMAANQKYIYYTPTCTNNSHISLASVLYYADGWNGDFTTNGDKVKSVACDAGGILDIAVTNNYLLLGTSSGLAHVSLSEDKIPSGKKSKFANNGDSIISEYVFKVFVLEPEKDEEKTDLYCTSFIYGSITGSSDVFDETGLYSYYPNRNNWNRDGTANSATGGN